MYIAGSCRTKQTIQIVQFVTLRSLTNPDDDGSKELQREKYLGVLLNFMRLFSLSQIAKCRGISQEFNS